MPDSFVPDSLGVLRVPALSRFEWLEHGFGTRRATNWPDLSRLAMLKQIHSALVREADGRSGYIGEGDALITDRPGMLVGVRTADCVPILLVDARRRAVAAVHAGWRGTSQAIVSHAVLELADRFGTSPEDLHAAIGPAIGACCYEVGPEVARAFGRWWPELGRAAQEHVHLDLAETNRRQLIDAGVDLQKIYVGAPCTYCSGDLLESFRRDGEAAGRSISVAGIRN